MHKKNQLYSNNYLAEHKAWTNYSPNFGHSVYLSQTDLIKTLSIKPADLYINIPFNFAIAIVLAYKGS